MRSTLVKYARTRLGTPQRSVESLELSQIIVRRNGLSSSITMVVWLANLFF